MRKYYYSLSYDLKKLDHPSFKLWVGYNLKSIFEISDTCEFVVDYIDLPLESTIEWYISIFDIGSATDNIANKLRNQLDQKLLDAINFIKSTEQEIYDSEANIYYSLFCSNIPNKQQVNPTIDVDKYIKDLKEDTLKLDKNGLDDICTFENSVLPV